MFYTTVNQVDGVEVGVNSVRKWSLQNDSKHVEDAIIYQRLI